MAPNDKITGTSSPIAPLDTPTPAAPSRPAKTVKSPGVVSTAAPSSTTLDPAGFKMPDPAVIGRSMADVAERSQRIVGEWLKRQSQEDHAADSMNIGRAFMEMTARLIASPGRTT